MAGSGIPKGVRRGCGRAGRSAAAATILFVAGGMFVGCPEDECVLTRDCPPGQYCSNGDCRPLPDVPDVTDGRDGETDGGETLDGDGGTTIPCIRPADCHDGLYCTEETCDLERGICVFSSRPNGTSCDDGLWCNGEDECQDGVCLAGDPPCGEEIVRGCMRDGCEEDSRTCGTFPAEDGAVCSVDSDVCGRRTGTCLDAVCEIADSTACDDDNDCTDDLCTPDEEGTAADCRHVPVATGAGCSDEDPCFSTGGRVCIAGVCAVSSGAPCTDGSLCVVTTCDGTSGTAECTEVTPTPPLPELSCGASFAGSTVQSPNDVADYGIFCGRDYTGGENVWQIHVPSGYTRVRFELTDVVSHGSPSVLALTDLCTSTSCVGASDASYVLSTPVSGDVTIPVVVDGRGGARATYVLGVTCL